MPAMPTLPELVDDLVAANRILAGLSVLDGFGHVSARHPDDPSRYLLSRSLARTWITAPSSSLNSACSVSSSRCTATCSGRIL